MSLIVRRLQKEKKNEVLFMLLQKTQMYFNELKYVMVHASMNITTTNGAKMAQKMPQ